MASIRKTFLVAFSVLFHSVLFGQTNSTGIIFFQGTWDELLVSARENNKLIFVDVYTEWCGPCKSMDQFVFTQPTVGTAYNTNFLNYKIDAEKGEGIHLAKLYGVGAYPTFLFLNSMGQLVHKAVGERDAQRFVQLIDEVNKSANNENNIEKLGEEFEHGNRNKLFLKKYLEELTRLTLNNDHVLDAYFNILSPSELEEDSTLSYLANHVMGGQTAFAMYLMEKYVLLNESSKAQLSNRLFDRLIRSEAGKAMVERRFAEYLTLRTFADRMYRLDSAQLSLLNQFDMKYGVQTKNYTLVKRAGYANSKNLLSIPIESIHKEDKKLYSELMEPFLSGKQDSSKIANFAEEKVYIAKIHSRTIASQLHSSSEAFSFLPSSEKQALKDALSWAMRGQELLPDISIFSNTIDILKRKISE